ncbi:MAG: esterase [Pseudomonadota bacterium]
MSIFTSLAAPFRRKPDQSRPSLLLLCLESRALLSLASLPLASPLLRRALPRGDGHAVMLLPGLLAGDASTVPLRRFLKKQGYQAHGWQQGRNLGPRSELMPALRARLEQLARDSGGKVSLVGWSLGGIYARELARAAPHLVRQVVTLGSPLYGAPGRGSNAWAVYRLFNEKPSAGLRGDTPPPVPTTSIYSRSDGIVGWGCSVERDGEQADNIDIPAASHLGLGVNPLVWYALGDRLAQADGAWRPFRPRGLSILLYPFNVTARRRANHKE